MVLAARQMALPERLDNVRTSLPIYIAVGEHDPAHSQRTLVNALVDRLQSVGIHDVTLKIYPRPGTRSSTRPTTRSMPT